MAQRYQSSSEDQSRLAARIQAEAAAQLKAERDRRLAAGQDRMTALTELETMCVSIKISSRNILLARPV